MVSGTCTSRLFNEASREIVLNKHNGMRIESFQMCEDPDNNIDLKRLVTESERFCGMIRTPDR